MKNISPSIFLMIVAIILSMVIGVASFYYSVQYKNVYNSETNKAIIASIKKSENIELVKTIAIESYENLKSTQNQHINTYEKYAYNLISISIILILAIFMLYRKETSNKTLQSDP